MQIEDYFQFLGSDDIRIKGHRIGIETVLYPYVYGGQTAEEIACAFPTLSCEQVDATIRYYLQNKAAVSRYLEEWLEFGRQQREAQRRTPSQAARRLRQIKAERELISA